MRIKFQVKFLMFLLIIFFSLSVNMMTAKDNISEDQKWLNEDYIDLESAKSPTVYGFRLTSQNDLTNYVSTVGGYHSQEVSSEKSIINNIDLLCEFYYDAWQLNIKSVPYGFLGGITLKSYGTDFNSGLFFNLGSTGDFDLYNGYRTSGGNSYNAGSKRTESALLYEFGTHSEGAFNNSGTWFGTYGVLFGYLSGDTVSSFYYKLDFSTGYKIRFSGFSAAIGINFYFGFEPYEFFSWKDGDIEYLNTMTGVPALGLRLYLQTGLHFREY